MTATDTVAQQLEALRTGAGIFPLTDRSFLRITGPDATRWLNGMVTNSIQSLQPGQGNYNFLLNAQGRIQGDCTIYREPGDGEPTFLLETDNSQVETIQQILDRFIIMDDVELAAGYQLEAPPIQSDAYGIALHGSAAAEIVLRLLEEEFMQLEFADAPKPGTICLGALDGKKILILAPPGSPVGTYEIWGSKSRDLEQFNRLWKFHRVIPLTPNTIEALRILAGRPEFGQDIRDRDLPQETSQTHALHFAKGCYLGQEIVERIRSRGQVHRTFTAFTLTGDLPALPAPLEANGKPAGELTSAMQIGDTVHALGYARREHLETRATLTYPGGTAIPKSNP